MVSINFEGAKQFYAKQPDKTAAQAAFDTLVNGTGAAMTSSAGSTCR